MHRILVTLRGYLQNPCIVELDLDELRVIREVEIDCGIPAEVPLIKRGFTEFQYSNGYLVAATWDRVCFLNPDTFQLEELITDNRFSDLHGLYIDNEGVIWLANTNMDGIYMIKNKLVEPFWHVWEPNPLLSSKLNDGTDFRFLTKFDVPFHSLHVNGVFATSRFVYVPYLGKKGERNRVVKRLQRLGILKSREMNGGLFIIDRVARKVRKHIKFEGLHNSIPDRNGRLYFTEYFGNSLIELGLKKHSVKRLPLLVPSFRDWGYLTRGLIVNGDKLWVGHTANRGWHEENPTSLVRCYRKDGSWTGLEIRIPGYAGVYSLIEKR